MIQHHYIKSSIHKIIWKNKGVEEGALLVSMEDLWCAPLLI
jgi:hypothetical protein